MHKTFLCCLLTELSFLDLLATKKSNNISQNAGDSLTYLRNINEFDSQKNVLHIVDIYVNILYTVVNVSFNLTFFKRCI